MRRDDIERLRRLAEDGAADAAEEFLRQAQRMGLECRPYHVTVYDEWDGCTDLREAGAITVQVDSPRFAIAITERSINMLTAHVVTLHGKKPLGFPASRIRIIRNRSSHTLDTLFMSISRAGEMK